MVERGVMMAGVGGGSTEYGSAVMTKAWLLPSAKSSTLMARVNVILCEREREREREIGRA